MTKQFIQGIRSWMCATAVVCFSSMRLFALTEVSGDYAITGSIDVPVLFTGDAILTISAGATVYLGKAVTNNGHTVTINLENGSKVQIGWLENLNGASTTINFNGGCLTDAGGSDSYWFRSYDGTGRVQLVSVNGNDIALTHPNWQRKYLRYACAVTTSGTGRFVVHTPTSFTANLADSNYSHEGGTCFYAQDGKYQGTISFTGDTQFPPGRVEIGANGANAGAWLNLSGKYMYADQVFLCSAIGGITNNATATSTLEFRYAGSVLDTPVYGDVKVRTQRAAATLTVKRGPISFLENKAGSMIIKPDVAGNVVKVGKLTALKGSVLTVDGAVLEVDELEIEQGTDISCVNGGGMKVSVEAGATNYINVANLTWNSTVFEKTGAGTMNVGSDSALSLDRVNVIAGTLRLGRIGSTTNRFWRVTFKATNNGGDMNLGPFRLYDDSCTPTDGAMAVKDTYEYVDRSTAGILASQLAAKEYICSRTDYSANKYKPGCMFWCHTVCDCLFSPGPTLDNPSSWVVMTYRIPDNGLVTSGYDVRTQWGTGYPGSYPGAWSVESSIDGSDGSWELMDEQSGQMATGGSDGGQRWYHSGVQSGSGVHSTSPYRFSGFYSGGGISGMVDVQVAADATFDASLVPGGQMISHLTVDCTTGGGTLKGVRLAAGGTLNFVNVPQGQKLTGYVIPLTFVDAAGTENASSWVVQKEGVAQSHYKLVWQNGGLCVPSVGTIIVIK